MLLDTTYLMYAPDRFETSFTIDDSSQIIYGYVLKEDGIFSSFKKKNFFLDKNFLRANDFHFYSSAVIPFSVQFNSTSMIVKHIRWYHGNIFNIYHGINVYMISMSCLTTWGNIVLTISGLFKIFWNSVIWRF